LKITKKLQLFICSAADSKTFSNL